MTLSEAEIEQLHRQLAPTDAAFKLVFEHCQIVWEVARQLLQNAPQTIDKNLVRTGCLLHDVGVYSLYDDDGNLDHKNYIRHGILGDMTLERLGFDEQIRGFASHHTGVGLTKHDVIRDNLSLPADDYLARSAEERLVMYADKFHSKTTPPKFLTARAYRHYVSRFGGDKVVKFDKLTEEFGVPDLAPLAAKYGYEIEDFNSTSANTAR